MAKAQTIAPPIAAETNWQPYFFLLIGIIIGGSAPVLVRLAQGEHMPTPLIVAARLTLSAAVLTPFVLRRFHHEIRRLTASDLIFTALAGVMLVAHFLTLFVAFEHTSILIAGVLSASTPLWVALMEVFVLRTRLNRIIWMGLFAALSGATIIAFSGTGEGLSSGSNPLIGSGLALVSAVLAGVYLIAGRKVRTHMPLLLFVWLVFSFGAVAALAVMIATGTPVTGYSTQGYLWLVMLTIGAQLIAQSAFNYSLAFLSATFISISGQAVTIVASCAAFFIFAEVPRPLQLLGSAVIIAGVVLASYGQTRKHIQRSVTEIPR